MPRWRRRSTRRVSRSCANEGDFRFRKGSKMILPRVTNGQELCVGLFRIALLAGALWSSARLSADDRLGFDVETDVVHHELNTGFCCARRLGDLRSGGRVVTE